MTCVPLQLLVRNECYWELEMVPSVSKHYHKDIICYVYLLDNPFFLDRENIQVSLVFVYIFWTFQTAGVGWG